MITVTRQITADDIAASDLDDLASGLADATGIPCHGCTMRPGVDINGDHDPSVDTVAMSFESAPLAVDVDAAIAAYPTIAAPLTGAVVVAKGVPVSVFERAVAVGQVLWLDIHVFGALGDVSSAKVGCVDAYAIVWRESSGDVRMSKVEDTEAGNIPGLEIEIQAHAASIAVTIEMRSAGTFTIFENSVKVKSAGLLP